MVTTCLPWCLDMLIHKHAYDGACDRSGILGGEPIAHRSFLCFPNIEKLVYLIDGTKFGV